MRDIQIAIYVDGFAVVVKNDVELNRLVETAGRAATEAYDIIRGLDEEEKTKVFVYGTLKRGFGNHRLLANSHFVGDDIVHDATLLNIGFFPGMIPAEGEHVVGEVYEVDRITLRRLDGLEGVPHMYRREQRITDRGEVVETYLWNESGAHYQRIGSTWPTADAVVRNG